ncbi:MAG TPA: hypothetical protein DDZ42_13615 [Candidatus Rokubacteria bacterium]|nr:MAG: hypothetical protein A2050_15885 [Candidatus Rokubacteria bacterium GWA2_73_35]HBH02937.1 hypothetical protein [Candidatus Rokubacteria bacterium]
MVVSSLASTEKHPACQAGHEGKAHDLRDLESGASAARRGGSTIVSTRPDESVEGGYLPNR